MSKLTIKAIRQGEIMLFPVNKMEGDAKKVKSFIVGHSETGHHHVLESKTEFDVAELDKLMLYVRLFEPADLVHQKSTNGHKTLTVPPGIYKVIHKTEYDPFQKVKRQVWD